VFSDVDFKRTAQEAATGVDCLVILTEWTQFRSLSGKRLKPLMRQPVVVDLRNIFNPEEMRANGFIYECVGRPQSRNPVEAARAAE
jgi:UDPglucose 6-dehydrogenase